MKFKKCILVILLLMSALFMDAERLSGSWNGRLHLGLQSLSLVFNVEGDSCTMDSPDQAAFGIPAKLELCTADSLIVKVPELDVSFEGELVGGRIEGMFHQKGFSSVLVLKRGRPVYKRTQDPQPPFPYETEEVTFVNPGDSAVLSGTLSYPVDYQEGKTPVVLMVTGSGRQNRDEEILYHRPFAVIAHHLALNGIASLRYDDRGKDKSTGNFKNATTETFADDAAAGLAFLRNIGKFGKVGLLGHSEGGTIAFILAGRGKTDFIVSLAGAALRGDKILVGQNRPIMLSQGVPERMVDDYCRALEKMYEYKIAYGSSAIVYADMAVAMAISETKADLPEDLRSMLVNIMKTESPWFNYFISYDPVDDIRRIKCPLMAVNGSLDTQVLSTPNLSVIRDNLRWKDCDVVREYEGLNHLFQHAVKGTLTEYLYIEETVSPEVLSDIAAFINAVTR